MSDFKISKEGIEDFHNWTVKRDCNDFNLDNTVFKVNINPGDGLVIEDCSFKYPSFESVVTKIESIEDKITNLEDRIDSTLISINNKFTEIKSFLRQGRRND